MKDGYSSVEILLSGAVSYVISKANILKWLEENGSCSGRDKACQMAVELAWLVGAWDVSYEELIEDSESQSADETTQRAAAAIAKAVVSGKKK